MRKKSVILSLIFSLILFLVGTAALGWVFTEQKKEKRLLQERRERFDVGLDRLSGLVTGEIDVQSFANLASSENRKQELDRYRARIERRELIVVVSIVCMFTGGVIFGWWLLLWTARQLIRGSSYLVELSIDVFRRCRKIKDKKLAQVRAREDEKASGQDQEQYEQQSPQKEYSKILASSGWHNFDTDAANRYEPAPSEKVFSTGSEAGFGNSAKDTRRLSALLSNEKSVEVEGFSAATEEDLNVNMIQSNQLRKTIQETVQRDSGEDYPELEDLFRNQTENLEKQMAEFKQMAQSVQQTTLERSGPLRSNLEELIQQVSAIREYASQQQGRMEKLQDGYDWNIIRTFCLRVIRCIDNLESRIARLSKENVDTVGLEEVRDELVFALESSGVERFEPEINSDYRGQERKSEAVKNKQHCSDPNLKGKTAKVIRLGYQYVIDDENVKVVRPARVELFG